MRVWYLGVSGVGVSCHGHKYKWSPLFVNKVQSKVVKKWCLVERMLAGEGVSILFKLLLVFPVSAFLLNRTCCGVQVLSVKSDSSVRHPG